VFWYQAVVVFSIWVLAGLSLKFVQSVSPQALRRRTRKQRSVWLIGAYTMSVVAMGGAGFLCMAQKGITENGMTLIGGVILAIGGGVFIVLQIIGLSLGISFALDAKAADDANDEASTSESTKRP
jgi:hypothetical protein